MMGFLHRLIHGKPRELSLGVGAVIVASGIKNGRPLILIRPAKVPGPVGSTPVGYSPGVSSIRATRADTIIWLDGPPHGLIAALVEAVSAKAEAQGIDVAALQSEASA
jgi:hypothetical protein